MNASSLPGGKPADADRDKPHNRPPDHEVDHDRKKPPKKKDGQD